MRNLLFLLFFCFFLSSSLSAKTLKSPSHVFAQVKKIEQEVRLILAHEGRRPVVKFQQVKVNLKPRHVWQKGYIIISQLNRFRKNKRWPVSVPGALEPVLELEPLLVYEQTQFILVRLANIKSRLGIRKKVKAPALIPGKRPIDVYNQLHFVSLLLDQLNQQEVTPTEVFGEVKRLFDDTSVLLDRLQISDPSFPPAKKAVVSPAENLVVALKLHNEISRLQRLIHVEPTSFSVENFKEKVSPTDVYHLVELCLADLQTLKAYLNVKTATPIVGSYAENSPAEVHQLLVWVIRKLALIQEVNR